MWRQDKLIYTKHLVQNMKSVEACREIRHDKTEVSLAWTHAKINNNKKQGDAVLVCQVGSGMQLMTNTCCDILNFCLTPLWITACGMLIRFLPLNVSTSQDYSPQAKSHAMRRYLEECHILKISHHLHVVGSWVWPQQLLSLRKRQPGATPQDVHPMSIQI